MQAGLNRRLHFKWGNTINLYSIYLIHFYHIGQRPNTNVEHRMCLKNPGPKNHPFLREIICSTSTSTQQSQADLDFHQQSLNQRLQLEPGMEAFLSLLKPEMGAKGGHARPLSFVFIPQSSVIWSDSCACGEEEAPDVLSEGHASGTERWLTEEWLLTSASSCSMGTGDGWRRFPWRSRATGPKR